MKGTDVVWSKELKDIAVYCMACNTAIESIVHYIVECIAKNDESLEEIKCDGDCQYEIDIYNEALTKVIQKSNHFKVIKKFLQDASEYYGGDYYFQMVDYIKKCYDLEVMA